MSSPAIVGHQTGQELRRQRWHRQARLTTSTAMAAKAIGIGARLLTIPMSVQLLGQERYGLWLTINSILLWVGFIGPGLGYGLINALSEANGHNDREKMRRDISTGSITIAALGMCLLLLIPFCAMWTGWGGFLGVGSRTGLEQDAATLLLIAGVVFSLSLSLEFVTPICAGLQEGYLTAASTMASTLLTLGGMALVTLTGGTLTTFALVVAVPPLVANAFLALYLFVYRHPDLRPSWKLWDPSSLQALMNFGGWMFLIQIAELGMFQSANILIARSFGPAEVPRYAIPAAIFVSITNVCYSIVQPYWPAVAEASARRDWDWIRGMMFQTLKIRTAIITAAGLGMIAAGPPLVARLAGGSARPSRELLSAMAIYYLLAVWAGNATVLMLGLGRVRTKALLCVPVAAFHVGGFFALRSYVGLSAMPIAGGVGVLLDCVVSGAIAWRHIDLSRNELTESTDGI